MHNGSTYLRSNGTIEGGKFFATGVGDTGHNNPAYYIGTGSGTSLVNRGWICYNDNGAGIPSESRNRVFFHTESGVALKLDSGSNMSIKAAGDIYLEAPLILTKGVSFDYASEGLPDSGTDG